MDVPPPLSVVVEPVRGTSGRVVSPNPGLSYAATIAPVFSASGCMTWRQLCSPPPKEWIRIIPVCWLMFCGASGGFAILVNSHSRVKNWLSEAVIASIAEAWRLVTSMDVSWLAKFLWLVRALRTPSEGSPRRSRRRIHATTPCAAATCAIEKTMLSTHSATAGALCLASHSPFFAIAPVLTPANGIDNAA